MGGVRSRNGGLQLAALSHDRTSLISSAMYWGSTDRPPTAQGCEQLALARATYSFPHLFALSTEACDVVMKPQRNEALMVSSASFRVLVWVGCQVAGWAADTTGLGYSRVAGGHAFIRSRCTWWVSSVGGSTGRSWNTTLM